MAEVDAKVNCIRVLRNSSITNTGCEPAPPGFLVSLRWLTDVHMRAGQVSRERGEISGERGEISADREGLVVIGRRLVLIGRG